MSRITTTTDPLNEPVAADAASSNEDVICDTEQFEYRSFERLRAELQHAFAVPDTGYTLLTAADVIARNER